MKVARALVIAAACACTGCAQVGGGERSSSPAAAHQPPSRKEAIKLLLQVLDTPLTVDPSCKGAGTELTDRTLGEYVSGFMAEQVEEGNNWIEVETSRSEERVRGWESRVLFRRRHGEERWGWGVGFVVRESDRQVERTSIRCLGAG